MGAVPGVGVILRVRFALGARRNGEEEVCKHAWRGSPEEPIHVSAPLDFQKAPIEWCKSQNREAGSKDVNPDKADS